MCLPNFLLISSIPTSHAFPVIQDLFSPYLDVKPAGNELLLFQDDPFFPPFFSAPRRGPSYGAPFLSGLRWWFHFLYCPDQEPPQSIPLLLWQPILNLGVVFGDVTLARVKLLNIAPFQGRPPPFQEWPRYLKLLILSYHFTRAVSALY